MGRGKTPGISGGDWPKQGCPLELLLVIVTTLGLLGGVIHVIHTL